MGGVVKTLTRKDQWQTTTHLQVAWAQCSSGWPSFLHKRSAKSRILYGRGRKAIEGTHALHMTCLVWFLVGVGVRSFFQDQIQRNR